MTDTAETPSMPAIPEAAIEAAAIALWNRDGGGPDPVPDYIRHDAYATLAAALPHLSRPVASAPIQDDVTEEAVEVEAIRQAYLANDIWEELEDHGSDGENRTTFRKLARRVLRARRAHQPVEPATATSPRDPLVILAGIEQFGLAPDGSDLRDLRAALTASGDHVAELERQIEALRGWDKVWRDRINTAEAEVARLERERDDALCDCDDMMWQRRRADERAEAAEAELAKAKSVLRAAWTTLNSVVALDDEDAAKGSDLNDVLARRLQHIHELAAAARDRRAYAGQAVPDDIQQIVEASRPEGNQNNAAGSKENR